ncbi:unnamed protein product [Paramecium sonneborni]|uniref:Uncharacterized protein n=1 Tax=Paramecium sonneborni TaxID=65129 RepID=A0A8S1LIC7_9CILI|nr:unnamed protein product [Paramecium sonneborni]
MDQILYLSWQTQSVQNKKHGKCIAFWDKNLLQNVGGYFNDGYKQGLWKDFFINFSNWALVFEIGEYQNDLRIGSWMYQCYEQRIGGGLYNRYGQKQGKWLDLDSGFHNYKQVIYHGEYNMNGRKIGIWDIMYDNRNGKGYKLIGGGLYDQEGNQKKIGKWVELNEGFQKSFQVIYKGKYAMNGMKVGRWDIMYRKQDEKEYKQIGGGSYDQEGIEQKIGKWVELDDGFGDVKQVTLTGQYNMNGMKIGQWDAFWIGGKLIMRNICGGGSYDQKGNQQKIGRWIELDEGFCKLKFVTWNGEYNQDSIKIGRWNTMYRRYNEQKYKQMVYSGGGSYDQEGNQQKIGQWIELDERFNFEKQVTYNGEYNQNGIKVGRWDIMFDYGDGKGYKLIGGGSYDQKGNQKMIGNWVQLDDWFKWDKQIIYNGEYNMKGKKVGTWIEMDIMENRKLREMKYN